MGARSERKAPYASTGNVLTVIRRYRERGLPNPINQEVLESIGITTSTTLMTLNALKYLGLIDDSGNDTEMLKALRLVSTAEYPSKLTEMLRTAYPSVFEFVDPATHSRTEVEDAFRPYEPATQRGKMVALFLGLCKEAGLISGNVESKPSLVKPTSRKVCPKSSRASVSGVSNQVNPVAETPRSEPAFTSPIVSQSLRNDARYDLVIAVIRQLPEAGKWTKDQRDRWLNALNASIDLVIEVVDEQGSK